MATRAQAKRSRTTALSVEPRLLYADASALVKLVIEEPESAALQRHVAEEALLATSRIATVEVPRATELANPAPEVRAETERLLGSCMLIEVSETVLRSASRMASRTVRTLDAIHLASALRIGADEVVAYDRRLLRAATDHGLEIRHPGASAGELRSHVSRSAPRAAPPAGGPIAATVPIGPYGGGMVPG